MTNTTQSHWQDQISLLPARLEKAIHFERTDFTSRLRDFNFTSINAGEYLGSGFNALVGRALAHRMALAMQGTTGLQDFLTAADLGACTGFALGSEPMFLNNNHIKNNTQWRAAA